MSTTNTTVTTEPQAAEPPRCHWCGGETWIMTRMAGCRVVCRDLKCLATGPFRCRSTPALAVAAYEAAEPTLRWTREIPTVFPAWYFTHEDDAKTGGSYTACFVIDSEREARLLVERAFYRGNRLLFAGPIPLPIDESEATK